MVGIAACALATGCATRMEPPPSNLSPAPTAQEIGAQPEGKCPLTIYRNQTSFQSLAFDFELPVAYINEVPIGKLRVGQSHCVNVRPGRYFISVREPNLFNEVEKGRAVFELKEGQPVYLRFALNFGRLTVMGGAASVSTVGSMEIVSEQSWQDRL